MSELDDLKHAVATMKAEVTAVAAELAVQAILTNLFRLAGDADPVVKNLVLKAFNDAADFAEHISIIRGKESGHLPETLRIIEQLRLALIGEDKPKREV
jgi:hypothetical protein